MRAREGVCVKGGSVRVSEGEGGCVRMREGV